MAKAAPRRIHQRLRTRVNSTQGVGDTEQLNLARKPDFILTVNSAPLSLCPAGQRPQERHWRERAARLIGAIALHAAPIGLLSLALPPRPQPIGGPFGQAVSITLVSSAPTPARQAASSPPSLAQLERRLSEQGTVPSRATTPPAHSNTRLSDLLDNSAAPSGAAAAQGSQLAMTAGAQDDPFARAAVSYRGDDPAKAARLQAKARGCARGMGVARLLVIINFEGYLVARPTPVTGGSMNKFAKAISAVERCAPFVEAATPGPPRSYEIEIG